MLDALVTIAIILISISAPWITPYDPLEQDPFIRLEGLNAAHKLGTDDFGRDVLSRIIYGSRISLIIGLTSVFFGMLAGTIVGMVAGYYRGKVETLIMRGIDVMMCFPDLILAIVITAVLGANLVNLVITLLVTPIQVCGLTLLYFDLRVRLEGFDLELMVDQMNAEGAF